MTPPPSAAVPLPPVEPPSGRILTVPDRGEFFVRDSGGSGPVVLLLHGWMFTADANWITTYQPLQQAGYRVIALDHRGHGRGLRSSAPFRLVDCAADAAGVLRVLDAAPAVAVGYSMGGPVAQLLARDHRDVVCGLVLCATAQDWQQPWMRVFWSTMSLLRLALGVFPVSFWRWLIRIDRIAPGPEGEWLAAELSRGSPIDLAEAGRELSRYDGRPWISGLREVPAAVVVTTRDRSVPPRKQRQLARALGAEQFDVDADHLAPAVKREAFVGVLLAAVRSVMDRAGARLAA